MTSTSYTIGQYLVDRLQELGIHHLFAVPGPHCAGWLHNDVEKEAHLQRFGTATPANAGYAADGYARTNGFGAVCAPYSVGTRPLLSPVAGAFAERVPVVVVTGAPPSDASDRDARPLVGGPDSNRRAYDDVTCAAVRITNTEQAPSQIDETLRACRHARRPVYLEIEEPLFDHICPPPQNPLSDCPSPPSSFPIDDIITHLRRADSAVVWGGVELQRYGLHEAFESIVDCLDVPYLTTRPGKGLLPEDHARFAGILDVNGTTPSVKTLIDETDYVLGLGIGVSNAPLPPVLRSTAPTATIYSTDHQIESPSPATTVLPTPNPSSFLSALRTELTTASVSVRSPHVDLAPHSTPSSSPSPSASGITYDGFFDLIGEYVDDDTLLMSGIGFERFGSQQLPALQPSGFLCQDAYRDAGYVTPAAIGADLGSDADRVLVFVGDGGFQMTAQCIGTMAEKGIDPIIFVLNNGVYATEQWALNSDTFEHNAPFSAQTILQQWHYRKLPDAFGGRGWRVETYDQLTSVVTEAFRYKGGPLLLDVRMEQRSFPTLAVDAVTAAPDTDAPPDPDAPVVDAAVGD